MMSSTARILHIYVLLVGVLCTLVANAFTLLTASSSSPSCSPSIQQLRQCQFQWRHYLSSSSSDGSNNNSEIVPESTQTEEEKAEAVGNLVENDEWMGLTLELSELVRVAVIEDIKKNTREFLGKDDYVPGDMSREVDKRVKNAVAEMRGKEVSFDPSI